MKSVDPAAAEQSVAEMIGREEHIAPAPRVSVQAFCETVETAAAIQAAGEDRRLSKAHLRIQMGGLTAAIEAYQSSPTPNVIILETESRSEDILGGLDQLAEVCDAGTRLVIIGRMNDVTLYRELVRRGVSDYLISPVGPLQIVRSVCGLFSAPDAKPVGRIIAVVGAKGGVAFIDRLLAKCTDHLSLLAAPAALERVYDFGADAFEAIFDSLRATVPCIVLDVPHQWTGWTKQTLVGADDILIVAAPDLANLRNTKNLYDLLKAARPNDHRPLYCLNQVGVPKRPEIKAADFAKALDDQPVAVIPFEPQLFGAAANNGQMIAEISAGHRTAEVFRQLAQQLTGRAEPKKHRSGLIPPLIEKLLQR
jgi:pilus assembly protein CpaE